MRYIRLDDLSSVELTSWEVLWGPETKAVKVKKSHPRKGVKDSPIYNTSGTVVDWRPHHSISANIGQFV